MKRALGVLISVAIAALLWQVWTHSHWSTAIGITVSCLGWIGHGIWSLRQYQHQTMLNALILKWLAEQNETLRGLIQLAQAGNQPKPVGEQWTIN